MVAIFGNGRHSTSYTVQRAENVGGRAVLHLGDVLCIVGMGAVDTFSESGEGFTADRDFATYGRTEHYRHAGRWVYNEDKSQAFQLTAIQGRKLLLEGASGDLAAIYTDADGDGRRVYWISDIGPGDTWRLPSVTWIERRAPGVYAVQATGTARLTLPTER